VNSEIAGIKGGIAIVPPQLRQFPPKSRLRLLTICSKRVIRPRFEGFTAMVRSLRVGSGFEVRSTLVASKELTRTVAVSLALSCLSLCVIVALTAVATAMPL
jgi:hypothetical protein